MNKNKLLIIILNIIINIIISQPAFAKSNLNNKLSNFFQKIEKKLDEKSAKSDNKSANIKPQIETATEIIVATLTEKLKLEDFGLLSQKELKIEKLMEQKIKGNFDSDGHKFDGCQGFTTDGEYFYVVLLSKKLVNYDDQATKILKISMNDYKIVAQKDFGLIGHSNSLTYNSKTKKIYIAPLWKNWKTIYECDTDLNNLKKINLYNIDGSIIKDKEFRSVTYLPELDQYIVVFEDYLLGYFDSEFKLIKYLKLNKSTRRTTIQALSTDGNNLYVVTNVFGGKPFLVKENHIIIYDMDGNYIDTYIFTDEFGYHTELEQITFTNGKCYGINMNSHMRISQIWLKDNNKGDF